MYLSVAAGGNSILSHDNDVVIGVELEGVLNARSRSIVEDSAFLDQSAHCRAAKNGERILVEHLLSIERRSKSQNVLGVGLVRLDRSDLALRRRVVRIESRVDVEGIAYIKGLGVAQVAVEVIDLNGRSGSLGLRLGCSLSGRGQIGSLIFGIEGQMLYKSEAGLYDILIDDLLNFRTDTSKDLDLELDRGLAGSDRLIIGNDQLAVSILEVEASRLARIKDDTTGLRRVRDRIVAGNGIDLLEIIEHTVIVRIPFIEELDLRNVIVLLAVERSKLTVVDLLGAEIAVNGELLADVEDLGLTLAVKTYQSNSKLGLRIEGSLSRLFNSMRAGNVYLIKDVRLFHTGNRGESLDIGHGTAVHVL